MIQGAGVEVKREDYQYFELNGEKRFKKMRVSQNYEKRWGDRKFTSTPLRIGVKLGDLRWYLPANH
jgi:hypothetical protein